MTVKSVVIDNETYYPWTLARMTGAAEPDAERSPGAVFLLDVAETYVSEREDIVSAEYPHDYISDLADTVVPVHTYTMWQIFTDLALWDFDSELITEVSAREFLDTGPGAMLYEIASSLLGQLLQTHDEEASLK